MTAEQIIVVLTLLLSGGLITLDKFISGIVANRIQLRKDSEQSLKEEVERQGKRIDRLEQDNTLLRDERNKELLAKTELMIQVKEMSGQIKDLQSDLKVAIGERDELKKRVEELECQLKNMRKSET